MPDTLPPSTVSKWRGLRELVRADAPHHDELLQRVQAGVPLARQRLLLRFGGHEPLLPVAQRLLEGGLEALEVVELLELHEVVPHHLVP